MPQSLLDEASTQTRTEEAVSRGQGRIYRRDRSPYWWVAYYYQGQQKREPAIYLDEKRYGIKVEATDENRAAAEKFLKDKTSRITTEQYGGPAFITPQQAKIIVDKILNDYVEHYKRGGKRGIPREVSAAMAS
jgi:hypothetical protein